MKRVPLIDQYTREEFAKMFEACKYSTKKLAEKLGYDVAYVRSVLRQLNMANPIGKPTAIGPRGVSHELVQKAYNETGNLKKAAEKLGISYGALRRHAKTHPLQKPFIHREGKRGNVRENGKMAQWLRANPGARLPKTLGGIAALTGLNKNTVKLFLYRRARTLLKKVKYLGDIRERNAFFVDQANRTIPTKSIEEYYIKIDPYSFNIIIKARTYAGFSSVIKVKSYEEYKNVLGL